MKRLANILLALLLVAACAVAQDGMKPSTALVPVGDKVHDFGTIRERDGRVSHTFGLRNVGSKPVAIVDVSAWCGCTTADYTHTPVKPGQVAKVTVTYNPQSRPGRFSKEVAVISEGGRAYTRLWVKGNVLPYLHPVEEDHPYDYGQGLHMSLGVISFPPLAKGQQYAFSLKVANDTDRPMTLRFVRRPDNRVLQMPDTLRLKPRERTTIRVAYRAPKTYTRARRITLHPYVNGKAVRTLDVKWAAK